MINFSDYENYISNVFDSSYMVTPSKAQIEFLNESKQELLDLLSNRQDDCAFEVGMYVGGVLMYCFSSGFSSEICAQYIEPFLDGISKFVTKGE